ncbi:MAG TPA: helix-turn-helix transcriptional regulator [Candidatus Woesebacteria bacterium]|nr:helix-turn-helix transcriptional regulator [Candidatus Woesebacteria bacterium]
MASKNDLLLGQQIQKLRRQKDLTQQELAEKADLSTKYIQFIENGNRVPSLKALYRIASALDSKVSGLFTF